MGAAEMKAGHTEEYVDGTSVAPWPQLDGVRPKTSPSLVDDRRSEDGEGRGGAKSNSTAAIMHSARETILRPLKLFSRCWVISVFYTFSFW